MHKTTSTLHPNNIDEKKIVKANPFTIAKN